MGHKKRQIYQGTIWERSILYPGPDEQSSTQGDLNTGTTSATREPAMSKEANNREKFIQQYRRKLQNDLDNMGYPGAIDNESGSKKPVIIDAGRELSNPKRDSGSQKQRREALQP
jgi:hypothetical protein